MKPTRREGTIALGLLLLWGAVLGLPLLSRGFRVDGHDFWAHTTWGGHFARQFWAGDLYPRWLVDHDEGLGRPTFFYPPLPFWLTARLGPLFPGESAPVSASPADRPVPARRVCRVLRDDLVSADPAGGRGASRRRGPWVLLMAVGTALLAVTHPLSLLMFAPLVPAYAALSTQPGRWLHAVAKTALGMVLGLSGAHPVPALTLQHHMNMQVLRQGCGRRRHYLYDWERVLVSGGHIFQLLSLMTLLGSIALAALLWRLARSTVVNRDTAREQAPRPIIRIGRIEHAQQKALPCCA